MDSHPYTCISCSLAFTSAALQRSHYSSDHHRYNAQRRIAGLQPISAESFNQKVLERRQEQSTSKSVAVEKPFCEVCRKSFASSAAYENHLNSKKHKEAEVNPAPARTAAPKSVVTVDESTEPVTLSSQSQSLLKSPSESDDADAQALKRHLEKRISQANFIPALQCLFCNHSLPDFPTKVKHMHSAHGFFIPDREYLVDEAGLVNYLAEVLSLWNACIFCGAAFQSHPLQDTDGMTEEQITEEERKRSRVSLEAVRKHMISKSHCKIPWDTEEERLELSDFYDFSKSYEDPANAGWEDVDGDDDEEAEDVDSDGADVIMEEDDRKSARKQGRMAYGDTPFELVLPSGKRIGHRALRTIYKQNMVPSIQREDAQFLKLQKHLGPQQPGSRSQSNASSNALVKSNLDQMVLAGKLTKSAAKKATKPEKAPAKQEHFRTKVGFRHNNQRHFRDELLQ